MANFDHFTYNLRVTVPERFRARQGEIILQAAELGAARAAEVAPVDTGRLKRSLRAQAVEGGAAFGSDVHYAGYQEFGTRYIEPRLYIKDGYETALRHLRSQGFS